MVSEFVRLIIVYHQSELVYLGDHQVFRQKEHYMSQRMDVIQIVDYLKVMPSLRLVQQLRLHKKEIQ